MEAEAGGNRIGEDGEPAGYQRGMEAVLPHRRDEFRSAGCQRDALVDDVVDNRDRQALQECDPLAQGGLEGNLAIHRARRDFRHLVLQADDVGKFVDAFLADHGGIHIGDEEFLAAALRLLHHEVDREVCDDRPQSCVRVTAGHAIAQGDVAGDAICQPVKPGCIHCLRGLFSQRGRKDRV